MTTLAEVGADRQQFLKLTADTVKQHYKLKLITAEAYILYLVGIHRSPGWKWNIEPKEFCKTWEIAKSTFYRAIASLKSKSLLAFEVHDTVSLWYGTDIVSVSSTNGTGSLTNETVSLTDETEENNNTSHQSHEWDSSLTDGTGSLTNETVSLTDETVVSRMGQEKPEIVTQQAFQNSTDIEQIETDSTESVSIYIEDAATASDPLGGSLPAAPLVGEEVADQCGDAISEGDATRTTALSNQVGEIELPNISTTLNARPRFTYVPPATQEEAAARREWRDKARKRLNSLTLANIADHNFLESCWGDPLLKVFVRAALKKRPEWRIVEIDGVLVQFDPPDP